MLKHYLVGAWRNLRRNRLFTVINLVGLSVGIAVFLSISGYVNYHLGYDKFYPKGDRIFRINYTEYQAGQAVLQTARTHSRTAVLIHEYLPEVEAVARVYNEKAFIFNEDVRIVDQNMLFADSSFMKVFPLELISGSAETSLTPPNSVVISASQAKAYFGDAEPMGKTLYFNEHLPVTVTGVFKDIPGNTSLEFDFLLSWSTMWYYGWASREGSFDSPGNFTFVRLRENVTDIDALNRSLSRMAKEHITHLEKIGHTGEYSLTPYEDLHVTPGLQGEIKPGINKTLLYALLSLGVFILVAAWINYINLTVARLIERADEIGVRKVFGASRLIISGQFLVEACMLSVVTFVGGYLLFLTFAANASGLLFSLATFDVPSPSKLALYFTGFVIITTIVAFYPAHFLSRYKPALIMRNKFGGKGRAGILHQSLMIFQLFLAVAVVGITLIASRQIAFMRTFDSGVDNAHAITLRAPASTNSDSLRYSRYTSFRSEVLQLPGFKSGTASMNIPGQEIRFHDEQVHAVGSSNEKKQSFWIMLIDEGYVETFGLSLTAGRNFNQKEFDNTCLINQTAARALGYDVPEDAVGTEIISNENKHYTIVGVFKDYHHESAHRSVDPIIFYHRHPWEYGYYSFRTESRDGDYLERLGHIWARHYPNDQYIYYFMDSFFEEQYKADELFGALLKIFSAIAIFVACLGLFGMATLAMVKRTKEIAVRKVLGATIPNLLIMLSKTYVRLIIISCAFAFPVAYYLTNKWLEGFVYKITVQWWMIILPGLLVLTATLLAIAGQSVKAALTNPAEKLRDS